MYLLSVSKEGEEKGKALKIKLLQREVRTASRINNNSTNRQAVLKAFLNDFGSASSSFVVPLVFE